MNSIEPGQTDRQTDGQTNRLLTPLAHAPRVNYVNHAVLSFPNKALLYLHPWENRAMLTDSKLQINIIMLTLYGNCYTS